MEACGTAMDLAVVVTLVCAEIRNPELLQFDEIECNASSSDRD